MQTGRVGGSKPGIGKFDFIVCSKANLEGVAEGDGGFRSGIPVGKLDDPDLAGRIWKFVTNVQSFKNKAAAGEAT